MAEEWRVHLPDGVFERWERHGTYSADYLAVFHEWVLACTLDGPPSDAIRVFGKEELLLAEIPGTTLVVAFLVVPYERLVIVKDVT